MSFLKSLETARTNNGSLLCVGLDLTPDQMPAHVAKTKLPLFNFNKSIIDATHDLVCAFKPNSAFYEAYGAEGIGQLKQTVDYLRSNYPDVPVILDAKRADIGHTNDGYVKFAYDYLGVDAVTLHPYLGREALEPFLARTDKGAIILCRTSNEGSGEFQDLAVKDIPLYQHIARQVAAEWNANSNCLLVIGATYPAQMNAVREIVGEDMEFLVPGIGAQGGDMEAVLKSGLNSRGAGLVINSSRGIIYASKGDDFQTAARIEATKLRDNINKYRVRR